MKKLLRLSVTDFKLIFRDPSLKVFLFLPLLIFLVINYFLPFIIGKFDKMQDYVIYIVIIATFECTQMFGFIYSMVLIDEKETEVAKVYGIIPVSKEWHIIFRMIIPMLITAIISMILLVIQPFYTLPIVSIAFYSLLSGFAVPLYAIGVTNLSKNRMEGMVWIKVFNVLVLIPIAAFFVPKSFAHVFGIFPTHWAFQSLYNIIESGHFQMQLIVGFIYSTFALYYLVNVFAKRHFA